jgi:D-alanyl-D-alanine carboxypeptidase
MKTEFTLFILSTLLMLSCQPQNTGNGQMSEEEEKAEEQLLVDNDAPTLLAMRALADEFSIEYLMGKFDPTEHPDFTLVDRRYANREGLYLRKDSYEAFQKMHAAALEDSVQLIIISATRNFYAQKGIWEAKWTGQRKVEGGQDASKAYPDPKERALKILEYSSMPSTSRHHWGTDMDLNALTNGYFEKGKGLKIYNWLLENAADFGFCQPYTEKDAGRPFGYNEEKWHWSYMPVAQPLTYKAAKELTDDMITGFMGSEVAGDIGVVEKYVLGINPKCK